MDGINTRIQATRIDNAGGLYGDVLRLGAETVNNTASGAIAARDILKIGAHDINNTDGALIYSGGALVVGGALEAAGNVVGNANTVLNASARIEAVGNIDLAVDNLTNRNDALITRIETTTEPLNKTYIQPLGSVTKYDVATLAWAARVKILVA